MEEIPLPRLKRLPIDTTQDVPSVTGQGPGFRDLPDLE